jgi:hypothetical protein
LRRNLLLLDLLLAALCALAGWRWWDYRKERVAEQMRFLQKRTAPAAVNALPPQAAPPAAVAGNYIVVAQQLLLAADRSPAVIIDVVPPKQMPPLPRAYGALDFGGGPRVVLAAQAGGPQRSYAIGETIGDFKVLAITRAGVVFEWDGKSVAARYDELRDAAAQAQQAAAASAPPPGAPRPGLGPGPAPAAPAPSGGVQSVASSAAQGRPGPGSGEVRPCVKGDNSPSGTIAEGYKKMIVNWGMGKTCQWEKID